MAQVVGYFEDNVEYTEGPFVAVSINGWRIESELKGTVHPVLPDLSITRMLEKEKNWRTGKYDTFKEIAIFVDWLNAQVKSGRIILQDKSWTAPQYERTT